ncbi:unnamed protein product [Prorocentrum cordatum]|uniref:Uncharacterized protein n=1 Tax=Prorocentrum cordatum TaxID=2364126 RepID=A0ABN9V0Z5_9DINO|nr:unnamed protein product [Polarella glacialis]
MDDAAERDSGDDVIHRLGGLGWHSRGCEQVSELTAGSVVFGSAPLSGCQAYLAEVCIE